MTICVGQYQILRYLRRYNISSSIVHYLTLFYRAVNGGHIEIPLPPYVIPVKINNKSHHEKGYIQLFAKNDQHMNSFIPRTIPIWNRLSLAIENSSNAETFNPLQAWVADLQH